MLEKYKEKLESLKFIVLEGALYSRSGVYLLESYPLLYLDQFIRFGKFKVPEEQLSETELLSEVQNLIKTDVQNLKNNVYPLSALRIENPVKHGLNLLKIYKDAVKVNLNKKNNKSKIFSKKAKEKAKELPDYYTRNFHHQTDGYLSEESANLYDQQVEMLFRGTADPMRRMILEPMRKHFERDERFRLLEVSCGTGVSTYPLAKTFENARIIATDLSEDYVKHSRKTYSNLKNVSFRVEQGEDLQSKDNSFDAWCSTYMFHELPKDVRTAVLKEAFRVLKPGGHIYMVDSIQEGDNPIFEGLLDSFPQNFHEPFYKNYIQNPMEVLFKDVGFEHVESEFRFSSKVVWATKPL
jgi:ubiquinone/menaquinone biosynthesis C-methylase UbiE